MGDIFMYSLLIMCNAAVSTNGGGQQSGGHFPFLAALILVVIILVVSIGDKVRGNKTEEEHIELKSKDQEDNQRPPM